MEHESDAGREPGTQPVEIKKDPQLSTTPEDFDKQFELLTKIQERPSAAHDAIVEILRWGRICDPPTATARMPGRVTPYG